MAEQLREGIDYFILQSYRFSFDPENFRFHLGDTPTKIVPINEVTDIWDFYRHYDNFRPVKLDRSDHLMLPSLTGTLIQTPTMTEKLLTLRGKHKAVLLKDTEEVMRAVYQIVEPSHRLPSRRYNHSFSTFWARIMPEGWFYLNTLGNCACLGQQQPPMFVDFPEHLNPTGFEYGLHNVDTPAQLLSLLAGAGTIAWRVQQEMNDV